MAAITFSRMCFGCGLMKRMRSMPSMAFTARSKSEKSRTSVPSRIVGVHRFGPSSMTSRNPSLAFWWISAHDLLHWTIDFPPAHLRHDAIGAAVIASAHDRDVSRVLVTEYKRCPSHNVFGVSVVSNSFMRNVVHSDMPF